MPISQQLPPEQTLPKDESWEFSNSEPAPEQQQPQPAASAKPKGLNAFMPKGKKDK
jgi:hypothetical protein